MTDIRGPKPSKKRLENAAFIKEVANRMFLPEETIQAVWDVSARVITEALLREEKVVIRRFGVFRLSRIGTARFKPSSAFRQPLKERAMEKYGVEMDNEASLMAKITGECPTCKAPLTSKDPPNCPNCGTAPFESKASNRQSAMVRNFGTTYGKPSNEE